MRDERHQCRCLPNAGSPNKTGMAPNGPAFSRKRIEKTSKTPGRYLLYANFLPHFQNHGAHLFAQNWVLLQLILKNYLPTSLRPCSQIIQFLKGPAGPYLSYVFGRENRRTVRTIMLRCAPFLSTIIIFRNIPVVNPLFFCWWPAPCNYHLSPYGPYSYSWW